MISKTPALKRSFFSWNFAFFKPASFLLLAVSLVSIKYNCSSSITVIHFSQIPYSDPDLNAPGRGAEAWYGQEAVAIPSENYKHQAKDSYYRFSWAGLESSRDVYDWTIFDRQVNKAIDANQKFSFGIMTMYEGGNGAEGIKNYDGASSAYPEYLHILMQSEKIKDWKFNTDWIPNWNSAAYISRWTAFCQALNGHLQKTAYKGINYKDVINYIDLRGYGNWGEWHTYPYTDKMPPGTEASSETLIRIIDAQKNAFKNFRLVALIAGFQPNSDGNTPPEVTYKLLTDSTNAGQFGWRRDSWGDTAPWYDDFLQNNPNSYNGKAFKDLIMNKWKYAPVVGEPLQNNTSNGGDCAYWQLKNQVKKYHVTSFGNGNLENTSSCAAENIRAASKASGYRLILKGGDVETESQLLISLDWQNIGVAPTYEDWKVIYQLTDSNNLAIWNGTSTFNPKLFIGEKTITDSFPMPVLKNGTYRLSMTIKDPNNYRQPLPLAIRGRNPDGSYTLTNINIPTSNPKTLYNN